MFFKPKTKTRIDNNLYTNIDDIIGYVGFITPEGGFYRVRQQGIPECEHGLWAYQHLENLGYKAHMYKWNENVSTLIEKFHYAMLMEDNDNSMPNYYPDYSDLTPGQKQVIDELAEYYSNDNNLNNSHHR